MFEIDLGNTGSDVNTFLAWSAQGTRDGAVRAKNFYIRDGAAKEEFTTPKTNGIVLDLDTMKTGWQKSEGIKGVAPEWKWNASVSEMQNCPGDRNDWKKGFSLRCAIGGGKVAIWEQAGPGVWQALVDLSPKLKDQPAAGQMPMVKMADAKELKFTKGSSCYPVLEIVKWVDRPDCLKEGAAAGIADEPAPVQQAPAAPAATTDDMEF
jgi:hypothetical protein